MLSATDILNGTLSFDTIKQRVIDNYHDLHEMHASCAQHVESFRRGW
jgi:hypothetical protein